VYDNLWFLLSIVECEPYSVDIKNVTKLISLHIQYNVSEMSKVYYFIWHMIDLVTTSFYLREMWG